MATQQYKTPGVYIQEPNSFPPSIVGVDTAVPCFIGYTSIATDSDNRNLKLIPKRIESMAEFVQFFGQGYPEEYFLKLPAPPKPEDKGKDEEETERAEAKASRETPDQNWGKVSLDGKNIYHLWEVGKASFNLYNSMRLFYANGGGSCYVISVGTYGQGNVPTIDVNALTLGIDVCGSLIGPTMVAIPDAVLLGLQADFNTIAAKTLNMCAKAQDRMVLLDVYGAEALRPRDDWSDVVAKFREGIRSQVAPEVLRFGAAYFPPLVTSVVSADEIDISNFGKDTGNIATLKQALTYVIGGAYPDPKLPPGATVLEGDAAKAVGTSGLPVPLKANLSPKGQMVLEKYIDQIGKSVPNSTEIKPAAQDAVQVLTHKQLTQSLIATVPGFQKLLAAVAATQGVLPTSGAMAGVWTTNDTLRGVWNAPANTGITTMVMPKLPISHDQQEELNVPVQGLAINAIRTFQGRGSLIWGARTLDSNSNDWRYIQVRRTMIYVEQSVKQALEAMVFRPNTAQTWVTVVSMIESFLHGLWAAGGLMGAVPAEAYSVQAGLGSTMTPQDVLEGVMRVHITLQMVHPAEFIELTFKQQMLGGA
jgi:phage tail sheath protein FI